MRPAENARAAYKAPCVILWLACLAVAWAADGRSCYNAGFKFLPTNWTDALEHNSSARLFLAKLWTSRVPPKFPLTIATHGNIQRDKHINQCRNWHGPLVAALYLPLVQENGTSLNSTNQRIVQEAITHFDRLHSRAGRHAKCQLTIMLFWEVFSSEEDAWLYPTNDLRNLALTQARTPLVAMIDIDLLISAELSQVMQDPVRAAEVQRICEGKGVVSLAAFQFPTKMNMPRATMLAEQLVRGSKADVVRLVASSDRLIPFAFDVFPPGHNATNYTRWYSATAPYEVRYEWHYEPWYILQRAANPWYDTSFRAYFYNKVMHAAHVASLGMRIMVHPTAYIMHRPHPISRVYSNNHLFQLLHNIMFQKSEDGKKLMAQSRYQPNPGPLTARCIKQLPWWTDPQYNWQDPANWRSGDDPAPRKAGSTGGPTPAAPAGADQQAQQQAQQQKQQQQPPQQQPQRQPPPPPPPQPQQP